MNLADTGLDSAERSEVSSRRIPDSQPRRPRRSKAHHHGRAAVTTSRCFLEMTKPVPMEPSGPTSKNIPGLNFSAAAWSCVFASDVGARVCSGETIGALVGAVAWLTLACRRPQSARRRRRGRWMRSALCAEADEGLARHGQLLGGRILVSAFKLRTPEFALLRSGRP